MSPADTPPTDDSPFATLRRHEVEAALAAEQLRWSAWQQDSADRQRQARREQRAILAAIAQRLDHERRLAAHLPDGLYTAVRYVETTLSDGPVRSTQLDAGKGAISERTYRRGRAWLTATGLLVTKPREGVWWVWLREPKAS